MTEDIYFQEKIEMLNALQDIEIAYNLIKSEAGDGSSEDPIDKHYRSLKTKIKVIVVFFSKHFI